MGVLLLLSQERWQKFVSFGFDHIISGFCYLIRQKFKLTSFSIACWGVSCTVQNGFWQFFNGWKKRKPLLGSCSGGRRESHLPEPRGYICFAEKVCHEIESPEPCEGDSSGAGRRKTGPTIAYSHRGAREEVWKVNSESALCNQAYRQAEQKPLLQVLLKMCNRLGSDLRLMPTGCAFTLFPLHSLTAGLVWWLTEHGNTGLLHI